MNQLFLTHLDLRRKPRDLRSSKCKYMIQLGMTCTIFGVTVTYITTYKKSAIKTEKIPGTKNKHNNKKNSVMRQNSKKIITTNIFNISSVYFLCYYSTLAFPMIYE